MQSVEKLLFTSQRTQFHLRGFISYSVPHLHSGCDSSFALSAGEKAPGWVCPPKMSYFNHKCERFLSFYRVSHPHARPCFSLCKATGLTPSAVTPELLLKIGYSTPPFTSSSSPVPTLGLLSAPPSQRFSPCLIQPRSSAAKPNCGTI